MSHLVYHDLSGAPRQSSPFDTAILKVCRSGAVGIVSPYIGVDYLQRIINLSDAWRLISDIEAWLSSLSMRARPKAWRFIRENLERIHHCPAIHAKVVIGQQLAMLGSANLTMTGILGRTEMGILIDEPAMVAELNSWFDTLWMQSGPPIVDEASAYIQWLDDEAKRSSTRREKFSLSASGMRIRASLVTLSLPQAHEHKGVKISLEEVAQGMIIEEQRLYESLKEALESAIDALAGNGFFFDQLVENVRKAFPHMTIREIYFALLQHCANHVRSVFSEDTRNRLILINGRFTQSSKELIHQALDPFDTFLAHLVEHLDFSQSRNISDEDELQVLTGIRGQNQTILVSGLLECGFLEIEDIAGHLPQYRLSEAFEWIGRYQLFIKAMYAWNAKKNRKNRRTQGSKSKTSISAISAERVSEPDLSVENISLSDYLLSERKKAVVAERARDEERAASRQRRHDGIDKILAHMLLTLLSGKQLPRNDDMLVSLPGELNVNRKWVQQVIRGESDIPRVVVTSKTAVSIDPSLDWKHLADYPLTQSVCKIFLET